MGAHQCDDRPTDIALGVILKIGGPLSEPVRDLATRFQIASLAGETVQDEVTTTPGVPGATDTFVKQCHVFPGTWKIAAGVARAVGPHFADRSTIVFRVDICVVRLGLLGPPQHVEISGPREIRRQRPLRIVFDIAPVVFPLAEPVAKIHEAEFPYRVAAKNERAEGRVEVLLVDVETPRAARNHRSKRPTGAVPLRRTGGKQRVLPQRSVRVAVVVGRRSEVDDELGRQPHAGANLVTSAVTPIVELGQVVGACASILLFWKTGKQLQDDSILVARKSLGIPLPEVAQMDRDDPGHHQPSVGMSAARVAHREVIIFILQQPFAALHGPRLAIGTEREVRCRDGNSQFETANQVHVRLGHIIVE